MARKRKKRKKPDPIQRCEECKGTGKWAGVERAKDPCRMCAGTGVKTSIVPEPLPPELGSHDPMEYRRVFWPHIHFYKQQREIIYSVRDNDETYVPAGNMLGKDFVSGFILLWFFLSRRPCRVVTTSIKDDHQRVLWGEVNRFLKESKYPLTYPQGPLLVTHREIRFVMDDGKIDPLSYVKGMVAGNEAEGLSGHHIAATGDGVPRTLMLGDEASGLSHVVYEMSTAWASRLLFIGNCWPCENFFKWAIKGNPELDDPGGDVEDPDEPGRFYRKVIRIKAEDSPNVEIGLAEERIKKMDPTYKVSGSIYIPGVLPYKEYKRRRRFWDPIRQCVGLDADFYEGAAIKMFPPDWLNRAESIAATLGGYRKAETMGVDTAQGGDNTCWTIVDRHGIIDQISLKTPDTSVIPERTLGLMRQYGIKPENILFDPGGGGREHADRLRKQGYAVRTVPFGATASPELTFGFATFDEKEERSDVRFAYKNKRAEMYGYLRELLSPEENPHGFGIPAKYTALRRQLQPLPLWYDEEGRLYLPPKRTKPTDQNAQTKITMIKLIGRSPDEADSLVLATYGLKREGARPWAGALF